VEEARRLIDEKFDGRARILDIGAGSGAISLSLLNFCPKSTAWAWEVSPDAASICLANASALDVSGRLTLQTADFLVAAEQMGQGSARLKYDIFVSNPPYIRRDLIDGLAPEVRDYEPHLALLGLDHDGLGFYRAFAQRLPALAAGAESVVLAEIGQGQGEQVRSLFEQADWQDVRLLADLCGIERVLKATCPKS
jgi:release factor glutamine methyltransferase